MREQIPNIITVIRILSIAPICWLLWKGIYGFALALLVLAGLSDALDGFLARRYGWFTRLGAILDPLADKLFVVSVFIVFGLKGSLPWWLIALVIGRDVVIVLGAIAYRLVIGGLDVRPLIISKLNTGLQIFLLAATLLHVAIYPLPGWFNLGLQWAVAVTTVLSGLAYVLLWSRYAWREYHA
ncbi:CDP-diacylglycerol--glycerol-3-phosphate 3-phosphatidyltransferase [Thiothrix caldifontis]|uniref:CDP-diacylglycerol--glycerol-3-phosphate 3-phosphatidyltransferase n=1 Tax=Thiothrix caldifontis TaxID=525918 RepID=A0A1H4FCV7_9GAMM|nr:CDP-alcohol phosphatidyltransferase family protein [Thiothrix caldifontis]SEA95146.1 CDP-diacylglycerol--glycerol-3-phosphate 3-phosphatidyltransferase [Thiothrix caldifontis]